MFDIACSTIKKTAWKEARPSPRCGALPEVLVTGSADSTVLPVPPATATGRHCPKIWKFESDRATPDGAGIATDLAVAAVLNDATLTVVAGMPRLARDRWSHNFGVLRSCLKRKIMNCTSFH